MPAGDPTDFLELPIAARYCTRTYDIPMRVDDLRELLRAGEIIIAAKVVASDTYYYVHADEIDAVESWGCPGLGALELKDFKDNYFRFFNRKGADRDTFLRRLFVPKEALDQWAQSKGAQPMEGQRFKQDALTRHVNQLEDGLRELKIDPMEIPNHVGGTAGPKSIVRAHLVGTGKMAKAAFDRAWTELNKRRKAVQDD